MSSQDTLGAHVIEAEFIKAKLGPSVQSTSHNCHQPQAEHAHGACTIQPSATPSLVAWEEQEPSQPPFCSLNSPKQTSLCTWCSLCLDICFCPLCTVKTYHLLGFSINVISSKKASLTPHSFPLFLRSPVRHNSNELVVNFV